MRTVLAITVAASFFAVALLARLVAADNPGPSAVPGGLPSTDVPVQVIERDAIQALLTATVVTREQADVQMAPDEPVIGVSIAGQPRAYSIPLLTRHEVANDTLAGIPIAVTW